MHHRFPILDHIGNARRSAAVILEDIELVVSDPHDVGADDMGIDAARRIDSHHFRNEGGVLQDDMRRNALGPQDLLAMIEVVGEGIERPHALFDARRQLPPLVGREHPGNDVKGDQPFGRFIAAVDGESDALPPEYPLGFLACPPDIGLGQGRQPFVDAGIRPPDRAVRPDHFVEGHAPLDIAMR